MIEAEVPTVLTLEQAAAYLQVSTEDLRSELEKGEIPALRVGGNWRIKQSVLDRLLESPGKNPDHVAQIASPVGSSAASCPQEAPIPLASGLQNDDFDKSSQLTTSAPGSEPRADLQESDNRRTPRPSCVQGRIFVYNAEKGYGYARLPDNRVVWISGRHILGAHIPFPGNTVEFELVSSSHRGLEARAIEVLPLSSLPLTTLTVPSNADRTSSQSAASKSATPRTAPPKQAGSLNATSDTKESALAGTTKSQALYQKAALARTESNYNEARRLFKQAIQAGAGTEVYTAYFKMEMEKGLLSDARRIIQQAIDKFPEFANFYEMYGQMERRDRRHQQAEDIFRKGLTYAPRHVGLRWGLGQTLVQIGTDSSLREAGEIFEGLDRQGKLHKDDGLYQRFKTLQRSERANKAYDFFKTAGTRVGIAGRRDLPPHITDLVAEITGQELGESFGLTGAILVRCFHRQPSPIDLLNLSRFLRELRAPDLIGLQDGREVMLNPAIAFVVVPSTESVHDQVMAILSDNAEAIVPVDDSTMRSDSDPLRTLRDLLGHYLGMRDLYSSTLPVSGRRFFGREKLLLQLTDDVHHGHFLGIYGLRKTGKTSLVYQLRDEKLRGEATAYADLQASAALTVKDCSPLYWELERDLYLRLKDRNPEAANLLRLGKVERYSDLALGGLPPPLLFAEDIRSFLDALTTGRIAGIKHLVFVLDELERILPVAGQRGIPGYIEFFGLLRGLAQTYRGVMSSVVVAANAAISERGYWEGRENPVFALYKPVFLPPFTEDECREMIHTLGKGMSVYWDDEAVKLVFQETGGHPFLSRALCSRITRQFPVRPITVTLDMVQEAIPLFVRDDGDKLEQITELLHISFPEEESLLEQIALGETTSDVSDEALRHLLGYRLILSDGSGYRITLNLLQRWLRRQAGIKE